MEDNNLMSQLPQMAALEQRPELPEMMPKMQSHGLDSSGHKKALLQKLMGNLLSKPGRSMHEMINGVKDAIGAYKNYAKEWDNLSSIGVDTVAGGSEGVAPAASGRIQEIMRGIQDKKAPKDGGGGPGFQGNRQTAIPAQAQGTPNLPPQAFGNPMARLSDNDSMPPAPHMVPQQTIVPSQGNAIGQMPNLPTMEHIAGQPQVSNFNRPAPVNHLGIFGH